MAENNVTCSICGSPYHLCMSCKDSIKLHPYKIHCCSVDCYKVFQVIRGFSSGVYTKDEFKSKLKNIDLRNLDNYRENIKILIKDALKEDEIVVETSVVEEDKDIVEVETNDNMVIEKPVYSRKRNYKMEAE